MRVPVIFIFCCLFVLPLSGQVAAGELPVGITAGAFPGGQLPGAVACSLISLGVVLILLGYFLLVRTLVTDPRIIRFTGLGALLVLFSLLNMVLYPPLLRLTGNSPVLTCIALLGIVSLLIAFHYRMQRWALAKLERKNKRIRLASARKIIEKSSN